MEKSENYGFHHCKAVGTDVGMTAYMNEDAVYPVENFYDISKALKFKNARYLVEAVRLSGAFGIVPGDNVYGMSSFYSYLWKEKEKTWKGLQSE